MVTHITSVCVQTIDASAHTSCLVQVVKERGLGPMQTAHYIGKWGVVNRVCVLKTALQFVAGREL